MNDFMTHSNAKKSSPTGVTIFLMSFQQGKSVTKHIHPYSHNLGMPLIFYNNKIS